MTMQEVEEMVELMGWEIIHDEGDWGCTVWQGDHGVEVEYDDDLRVLCLDYIPGWALGLGM